MTTTLHSQPDLTQGATSAATPPLLPPPGGPTAVFYEYPPYGDANHLGTPCSEHHYDVPLLAPPPKHPPPAAPGTASTASLASSTKPPQRSGSLSSFSSCESICILLYSEFNDASWGMCARIIVLFWLSCVFAALSQADSVSYDAIPNNYADSSRWVRLFLFSPRASIALARFNLLAFHF